MSTALSFNFLVILNLLVLILWPGFGVYRKPEQPWNVLQIILLVLTAIAVVLDVIFLAIRLH